MPSALLPGALPLTLDIPDVYVNPHSPLARPDTALTVVITDKTGATTTLDSHAPDPGYRPRGIGCASQQGSGFHIASFSVSWPIDREHPALHLRDKVQFIGTNGDVAYEGFITDLPRSTDNEGRGTLSVQLAGYIADTNRQSFRMPFIDRDLSAWGGASVAREGSLLASNWSRPEPPSVSPDESGNASLRLQTVDKWASPVKPLAEAWYDAGPNTGIGAVYYSLENVGNASTGDGNWGLQVRTTSADTFSPIIADSGDLWPTPDTGTLTTASARYAVISFYYDATAGGNDGYVYSVHARQLAVIGNHGLSTNNNASGVPQGVTASDVIRYLVDTYCPKLDSSGVQDSGYPIGHLSFRDRTKVYDAILKVNSYHLWQFSVWEGGVLHYGPADLTKHDWQVRHDDVGNQIGLQGDSVEQLRNGIIVQFENAATGRTEELHPDDYPELRDDSIDNPFNQHGDASYGDPYNIPFPCLLSDALELGRLRMLEDNQVKAPGSFTVGPWIEDAAGVRQPVWMVRAGQTIRLTSSMELSDRPRLITEVQYNHDSRTATITVDSTARYVDALLDRALTALTAANLQV